MSTRFELGDIEFNDNGWGPTSLPKDLEDVPYAPFSKGDKLGRVADWTGQIPSRDRTYNTGVSNQTFNLFQQEDTFQLVDNTKSKPTTSSFKNLRPIVKRGDKNTNPKNFQKLGTTKGPKTNKPRLGFKKTNPNWGGTANKIREPSIEVKSDWKVLEEIEFNRLAKMQYEVPQVSDIKTCGALNFYDKAFDKITPKSEKVLLNANRIIRRVTTSNDPVIQQLAKEKVGNVFGTDSIIALLMAAPRSVYPWDIVVNRVGDQLFFDKRERSQIDLFTANETAQDPPSDTDGFNSPDALAFEASYINQSFTQQVLKKDDKITFPEPSPFLGSEGEVGAYRYRKFKLDESNVLVLRGDINGAIKHQEADVYLSVKTLLEYDPKVATSWRSKLDSQRGAIVATELKNNSNKLTRWTAQAILSGVDQMKIGFISRANPRDPIKHVILSTQSFKPIEFATQINFSTTNAWGIIKSLVDYCLALPEGRYVLVKDPNKSMMRLYEVPESSSAEIKENGETENVEDVNPEEEIDE